ncbi:MAG: hypothetical protein QGM46_01665 [Actinomycetota bacterium]|nr:hypothetical protein [Actinomycetota bacterium]MDK1016795.1 hypothetical protein [Actinomycetota bacterium]MDK1026510.1 hypothetical protein [Actinomycetota bacterium]MDK1037986.1 hypothetical protein [Actinomycetota bacterium]MDK1096070.1 hypothetical protein [Actinomycetota bacterium]
MMRATDVLAVSATVFFGGVTGWLTGETTAALFGAFVAGAVALLGARAGVRPGVMTTVLVGTMSGWLIGSSVVHAICLPATCEALEVTGGVVTAALSFIGVGLVAALVTRSFDEYYERDEAGLPPTSVGCETDNRR